MPFSARAMTEGSATTFREAKAISIFRENWNRFDDLLTIFFAHIYVSGFHESVLLPSSFLLFTYRKAVILYTFFYKENLLNTNKEKKEIFLNRYLAKMQLRYDCVLYYISFYLNFCSRIFYK